MYESRLNKSGCTHSLPNAFTVSAGAMGPAKVTGALNAAKSANTTDRILIILASPFTFCFSLFCILRCIKDTLICTVPIVDIHDVKPLSQVFSQEFRMSNLANRDHKIAGELPLSIDAVSGSSADNLCRWLSGSAADGV
jgi:hypothetical protein